MIRGYKVRHVVMIGLVTLTFGLSTPSAHAHEGHVHTKVTVVDAAEQQAREQMIKLLKEIIALLNTLHTAQAAIPAVSAHVPAAEVAHSDDEMEMHYDEHAHDTAEAVHAKPKLVIEVEKHFDRTHVHVRYTDKPEDMFFVDAAIDNEDSLVTDIVTKTGLGSDVVRSALTYLQ